MPPLAEQQTFLWFAFGQTSKVRTELFPCSVLGEVRGVNRLCERQFLALGGIVLISLMAYLIKILALTEIYFFPASLLI